MVKKSQFRHKFDLSHQIFLGIGLTDYAFDARSQCHIKSLNVVSANTGNSRIRACHDVKSGTVPAVTSDYLRH